MDDSFYNQSLSLKDIEPLIMRRGSENQMYLNPDFAYLVWAKCGSLAAAARYLKEINLESYQGKHYSRQGIHLAAVRSKLYAEAKKVVDRKRKAAMKKLQK